MGQEMCGWDWFESLWESLKSSKITGLITWKSAKGGMKEIVLGPFETVLLDGIWQKRYQMKADGLLFPLVAELLQNLFIHITKKQAAKNGLSTYIFVVRPIYNINYISVNIF